MTIAAFRDMGVEVLMSGMIGDGMFCYMDTERLPGIVYEFVGRTATTLV